MLFWFLRSSRAFWLNLPVCETVNNLLHDDGLQQLPHTYNDMQYNLMIFWILIGNISINKDWWYMMCLLMEILKFAGFSNIKPEYQSYFSWILRIFSIFRVFWIHFYFSFNKVWFKHVSPYHVNSYFCLENILLIDFYSVYIWYSRLGLAICFTPGMWETVLNPGEVQDCLFKCEGLKDFH